MTPTVMSLARTGTQDDVNSIAEHLRVPEGDGERDFARWVLQRMNDLIMGTATPTEVDREMTALLKAVEEDTSIRLSEPAEELLFEVQTIHDLGSASGCDLDSLRSLAEALCVPD